MVDKTKGSSSTLSKREMSTTDAWSFCLRMLLWRLLRRDNPVSWTQRVGVSKLAGALWVSFTLWQVSVGLWAVRPNYADPIDADSVPLFRDSSLAPLLLQRRRLKVALDVLVRAVRVGGALASAVG